MEAIDLNKIQLEQASIERKLDEHIFESKMYREQNQVMFDRLLEAQQKNTDAITDLTEATAGIIEVYQASQGAIKVGSAFGRFAKWLSGIAIIGVAFKWTWSHLGGPPFT
jgi:hypothetical protein